MILKTSISAVLTGVVLSVSVNVLAQTKAARDSVTMPIAPGYDTVSNAHRFFFGEGYRKLWAEPVKVRVMDMQTERGGMKILQLGGGMETRSLRLQDASGKEWALRTVQKYPERKLPDNLKATIVKDIVQDQIATTHPFSALVVPPLAEALNIPHANPELVYLGDDPGLGTYQKEFSNAVYLLEERSPEGLRKSDNTLKVYRKLQEDNDTYLDQKLVLRSRLLDFILGDYDKHDDNWRWIREDDEKKDIKTYIPVPRDRDKVFYKTSGLLPWILSHQWLKANIQPYEPEIRAVDQWNIYQRHFDRYFLNGLDEEDWRKAIKEVQDVITPELLEKAFRRMPENIYSINGEETLRIAIARTKNLDKSALDYYRYLSRTVDVPATDKRELVELEKKAGGEIKLTMHNIKKNGDAGRKLYQRTFEPGITKEIRVYGMGGEDEFRLTGTESSPIVVRMIGGNDQDSFEIDAKAKNRGKTYIYDRSDETNNIPSSSLAKLRLAKDTAVNYYNRNSYEFDRFGPLVHLNYNIDQGIQPGVGLLLEKQGFRRTPYAQKQEFWIDYSTGRKSFILSYAGDFKKVIGNTSFKINANLLGPNNLSNFFGLGNETAFIKDEPKGMSYYRNRYDYFQSDFQFYQQISKWTIGGGPAFSYYTSSESANDNRFLSEFNQQYPEMNVFSDRAFAGLLAEVRYDSRDQVAIPTKGMYWNTRISGMQELNNSNDRMGKIQTEFRYYANPGKGGVVIANRLGGGTTFGDPQYFQLMQLGGVHNLRGFHTGRFSGKTMVYENLDLRVKLFNFTSYIVPGSVGLLAFNDIGRVWYGGESSDQWHYGYGGGLYVVPAEMILIQAAVGFSKESTMPYISVGFNF
ncbi:BamA/TamA family outer membrane protein [Pedobacter antarcticus]|uniref:BamA/TamA family outer membrane protein n=1 Tax=Pedobacter antarcticus TaxID=34086 RepID=UPI00292F9924|nr:BamA/TamA family outer membrane protein [Pedobacter antarcticus]